MEALLQAVTDGLRHQTGIAALVAGLWGAMSFLMSPCHLAMVPLVVAFVSGQAPMSARRPATLAAAFAMGLTGAIAVVGLATFAAGRIAGDIGPWAGYAVAAVFIVAGLALMGVLTLNWGMLHVTWVRGRGIWGAAALGFIGGAALGPCTFAYLAPVLGVAFADGSRGGWQGPMLVASFAIGHGAPIVVLGAVAGRYGESLIAWNNAAAVRQWRVGCGAALVLAGLYQLYAS
jgi:cytochrome c-type biogenesis protein